MDAPSVATHELSSLSPSPAEGPPVAEFLLEEYRAYREALNENERIGEGRVNLFLTITTAVLGALALKEDLTEAGGDFDALFLFLLGVVFLFGMTTLARMLHRKRVAHKMKKALAELRAYFCDPASPVAAHLAWKPREKVDLPEMSPLAFAVPENGGLVDATALLNSAVFGALATQIALRLGWPPAAAWPAWGTAFAGFLVAWAAQVVWVRSVYAGLDEPRKQRKPEETA